MVLEKLPPHDIQAEEAVLGAIMVDTLALPKVSHILKADDFFREKNSLVFAAALRVAHYGKSLDPITLGSDLMGRELLESIGGAAYLMQLCTELPTAYGVEWWAGEVRKCAIYRRLISAAGRMANLGYQGGEDLISAMAEAQSLLTAVQRDLPGKGWRTVGQITSELRPELERWADRPEISRGISTGLWALNAKLLGKGLLPGKTYVIGGQTSVGKSTFLRIILRNIALNHHHVGLFTLEQSEEEVVEELAFGLAQIDRHYHESVGEPLEGDDRERYFHALDTLEALATIHVEDSAGLSPEDVKFKMSQLCSKYPIKVIGLDYLHILEMKRTNKTTNREQEVSTALRLLRDSAKELGVTLLMMAQLNGSNVRPERAPHEFRPILSDYRDSGAVSYLPYAVLGLHRRDYYVEKGQLPAKHWIDPQGNVVPKGKLGAVPELDHTLEVVILKQARGPTGSAYLKFDGAHSSISDWNT